MTEEIHIKTEDAKQEKNIGKTVLETVYSKNYNKAKHKCMYKCKICTFETNYTGSFSRHISLHTKKERMYYCHQCLRKTKCKSVLHSHIFVQNNNHNSMLNECRKCLTEITGPHAIKILIHKNLDKSDSYFCHFCLFQTEHNDILLTHMIIHKNNRPETIYRCYSCSYKTKYKHHLRLHVVSHKNNSEVVMQKCEQCPFKSKYTTSLRKHLISHQRQDKVRKYKCYLCPYKAKLGSTLKRHLFSQHKVSYDRK